MTREPPMWLVMRIRPWSACVVAVAPFGGEQLIRVDGLGIGFLPVFEDRDEALAHANGDESALVEVHSGPRPEEGP